MSMLFKRNMETLIAAGEPADREDCYFYPKFNEYVLDEEGNICDIVSNGDPIITKQSAKDSTDINKMLEKAQSHTALAHLMKYPEATYGS